MTDAEQAQPQIPANPPPDASPEPPSEATPGEVTGRDQAPPAREKLTPEALRRLEAKVEAALLTSERAMNAPRLAEALNAPAQAINAAVASLNEVYDRTDRSFRIEAVAGGWQIMTLPEHADVLANLNKSRAQNRLSPAALETLAIVAYKQPIIRAEVENIRGVACGEVLRSLMERHLIKIVGRADEIGRPMLYGTTKTFLETFGLSALKDLPKVEELKPKG